MICSLNIVTVSLSTTCWTCVLISYPTRTATRTDKWVATTCISNTYTMLMRRYFDYS